MTKKTFFGGGIIRILDELILEFSGDMLKEIQVQYSEGYSPEDIGEHLNRDPDEIFLALFHLAREGKEIDPMAKRIR